MRSACLGFTAHAAIGSRAITRSTPFRWLLAGVAVCTVLTAWIFPPFLFFADAGTRAALIASNTFLWATAYAFLILPMPASRVLGRDTVVFGRLAPTPTWAWVSGRFVGLTLPFLVAALVIVGIGSGLAALLGGEARRADFAVELVHGAAGQLLVGAVAISGVAVLSQAGNPILAAVGGVIWFLAGAQKAAVLEGIGSPALTAVASIALAWLPDLTLFPVGLNADTTDAASPWLQLAYALLIMTLNLAITAIWAECRWRRATPRRP